MQEYWYNERFLLDVNGASTWNKTANISELWLLIYILDIMQTLFN